MRTGSIDHVKQLVDELPNDFDKEKVLEIIAGILSGNSSHTNEMIAAVRVLDEVFAKMAGIGMTLPRYRRLLAAKGAEVNRAPWLFLPMVGGTIESICNMLWCVMFRMDSLTPSMLSWLLARAFCYTCILGIAVCIWSFCDTRKKDVDDRKMQAGKHFQGDKSGSI